MERVHQPSQNRRAAALVGTLLAGAACLALYPRKGTDAPPPQKQSAAPVSVSAPMLPLRLQPQLSSAPVLLSPGLQQAAGSPSAPRSPLDEMRDRVMIAHPDLAQFRHLQRKVLLHPEEKESLRGIYQDPQLRDAAKLDLLAENEKTFSEDRQFLRLYRVEYLGMGLEWKDNPHRAEMLTTVQEVILAKNIHTNQDLELRRSLAGDKVELFMILLHNDRAQAELMLDQNRGTDLEKLLAYAKVRYDVLQRMVPKG